VAKATAIGVVAPALSAVVGGGAVHPDDSVVPSVEVPPAGHAVQPADATAKVPPVASSGLP
jgi:hypothetical protein